MINSHESTYHVEHSLNFNCGYASTVIDKIVGSVDLQRARARNNAKAKFGTNTRMLIKNMKKLTSAGQLVRVANTHEIGLCLLEEIKLRKRAMDSIQMEKQMKKRDQRFEAMDRYINMKEVKNDESKWNNSEFKVAIRALKIEKDGRLPVKKTDMIALWNKIKHREGEMRIEHKAILDEMVEEEICVI